MPQTQIKFDSVRSEITRQLDEGEWNGYRRSVLFLAALAVILDGLDNQILGIAIPSLIEDWGVTRADFPLVLAVSLISMSIGTAIAGAIGDYIGRRPALIGSVLLFGVATTAIAFVNDLQTLTWFRAVAALGLGGAMPNATAMLAEFSPAQRRNFVVSLGIVCVPLGGLAAGLIAALVVPEFGWRALFLIGGILPLLVGITMLFALPESPNYLMRDERGQPALAKVMARLGSDVDTTALRDADGSGPAAPPRSPITSLFTDGYARDTLALWLAFFAALLAVYSVFSWGPTLLTGIGFDIATASTGLAVFNLGGIAGALGGAWLMDRYGSKWPTMLIAASGAALSALIAIADFDATTNPALVIGSMAILGVFVPGFQVMLFSLAASVYPALMRATGVGAALAIGRSGAVVSSFAGAAILGLGADGYFGFIAAAMAVAAAGVALVGRHTSRKRSLSAEVPNQGNSR